ncbi:alpha-keto acid decarboxylase family protein [Ferrimonas marina]|uniref:Indolepyruvate decarboxylase n=1 Tax=Ferrimonas marina TaxID=299255 RepID=A0A1M5R204_9GAMM|nr:thiamine pyrophosphate-binding protein [Ferrimonas marina]SHH20402.1 indolepyruvate decarboxylase [Ferrimonas marina]
MSALTVADYLVQRLAQLGITDFFGLPGDFNLNLCTAIEANAEVQWVGCASELNAGYAADGYARIKGFAALVTSFGVGELAAANAIAGSYAEHVPVFHIVGSPARPVQDSHAILHHSLGDGEFGVFERMAVPITAAQTHLTADNAMAEIERMIDAAINQRRPVYINLPADVCQQPIHHTPIQSQRQTSSTEALLAAKQRIVELYNAAQSPVIIGDATVMRYGLAQAFTELVEQSHLPCTTLAMGKSLIDESHPNFIGTLAGDFSHPEVKQQVEDADLVIAIGTLMGDQNSDGFAFQLDHSKTIEIQPQFTQILTQHYAEVTMADLLQALVLSLEPKTAEIRKPKPLLPVAKPAGKSKQTLTNVNLHGPLQAFIQPGDILVCETGTLADGLLGYRLPSDVLMTSQLLWMSIGWATPAAFGAAIAAPERRVVLLTGDGSHQLTALELGQMVRYNCDPIVCVLNSDGFAVERYQGDDQANHLNEITVWDYTLLPQALGAERALVRQVDTIADLTKALTQARKARGRLSYIEALIFTPQSQVDLKAVRPGRAAIINDHC